MQHLVRALAFAAFGAAALSHRAPIANAAQVVDVVDVRIVQRITGPSRTGAVAIGGTDLGHMVNHQGMTYLLFGDTFSGNTPADGGLWRSNVMAYTDDPNPANGLSLDGWITNAAGEAREVIASGLTNPITEIPTGAISSGGKIYAWFMAVNWWGPAGEWTNNYAGLASWQTGDPVFDVVEGFQFPGSSNFGMVAASRRDDLTDGSDEHIYLWGTPAGRLGGVKLARVAPASIENHNAYQYFGGLEVGQPTWVASESGAPLIVPPTVGEMSVMYNHALESWTMLSMNHQHNAIELRQAPAPWGPWSAAIEVASGAQFPGLYGSYMNPLYVENGGETIYFTMSLWNPYDVYLVKATFVTAPQFAADFDGDGDVDAADLTAWRNGPGGSPPADADDDGDSDGADFLQWQRQLGSSGAATVSTAPEPAAAWMAALAALGLTRFRGRRAASRCVATSLGLAAMLGAIPCAAAVTYLDADWTAGNTVDAATGLDPTTVDNVAVAGNVWSVRHPFGNGGSLLHGRGDAAASSTPELKTTIAGLAPGNYDLYVFYWSDNSADWSIRAGLESGMLTEYDTSQPLASTLSYAANPLFTDGPRSLHAAKVGQNVAVTGGSASIFINDLGSTSSNDRTWYDGVGYGPHVPPPAGVDFVAGDLITFTNTADAPNGAWSWFEDERVIVDAEAPGGPRIVVSSISYAASGPEAGDVDVLWYDVNTAQQGAFELHDRLQNDDHNSAALWIRPDGRYLAAYSSHTTGGTPVPVSTADAQQVRYRISEPHDASAWGDEFTHNADGFRITTYNNLHYLPSDDGGAGRLYNFHRNVGFDPHILVSSDHGDTWTAWGNLVTFGTDADRPYVKYASNGDEIHFITTEAHSNAYNTSIYAGYVKDGQLFASGGATLDGDLSSGTPVNVTALTSVFNVNAPPYQGVYSSAWTVDAEMDDAGNPYVVFQARIDPGAVGGDPVTHQYFYARMNGGAWTVKELALGGGSYAIDGGYSGLVALHPRDPDRVFLSTEIDPRDGAPTPFFEIYQGVTHDGGDSWTWTAITENSTMDNARPIVPDWDDPRTALLWMRGAYQNYEDWSTEVVGLILPQPDADFDSDDDVDGADFLAWQRGLGLSDQTDNTRGDADASGQVDGADLAAWRDAFGTATALATPSGSLPEPAAGSLALAALAALLTRRRG